MLVLAAGLAGCGGDDEEQGAPIPQQAASDIEARLGEVERRMEAGGGACGDIQNDTKPAVEQIVASLPSDVDADVRDALQDSVDRLFELTAEQCDEQKGQEPDEEEPPVTIETEPETDTETTETVPPETETAPPETDTDEQPLPDPDEELPPGQGNGNGNGGGNGGGLFAPEELE